MAWYIYGANNQLNWSFVGNTPGFGQIWDGRPSWIGKFSRTNRAQVLFYFPDNHNWHLGTKGDSLLTWTRPGNTEGFGRLWPSIPFWVEDFNGDKRDCREVIWNLSFFNYLDCNRIVIAIALFINALAVARSAKLSRFTILLELLKIKNLREVGIDAKFSFRI